MCGLQKSMTRISLCDNQDSMECHTFSFFFCGSGDTWIFFSLGEAFFGYKTQHVPINQVPEASRVRWELERTFRFQKSADERGLNAAQWLISKHVFSRHFGDQTFPLTKGVTSLPMIYTIQNRNQSEDTSTIGCSEPSHGRTSGKWMQMPWATVWH